MNKFVFLLSFLTITCFSFGQANLPTFSDFSGLQLPNIGWTASSPQYYASSGNPAPSFKFDNTNQHLLIHVANEPLLVNFDLTSNGVSNPNSVFKVVESPDNINFTDARIFDSTTLIYITTYTNFTISLLPSTRYVKFIYTHKASPGGGNIGLDNVLVTKANVSYQQMLVEVSGNAITLNATQYTNAGVGDESTLPFILRNLGSSSNLIVDSIKFVGTHASEYSLAASLSFPLTISPQSNANIGIKFSPLASGLRTATATIYSNDTDFPSFSFDLEGFGGNYEDEPEHQPTDLSFSGIKTYRFSGSFVASDAEGFLVLQKKGSPITTFPQDGQTYVQGDNIGGAKVLKVSPSTSFVAREIVADSEYHFAVFAYNGSGQFINYLTDNPLTGTITTPETMQPTNYYNVINILSTDFVVDLHNLISPHIQHSYATYKDKLIEDFYERDTTGGKKALTCLYTNESYVYEPPFSHSSQVITREHTFAYSWFPLTSTGANYYSDYHNLFPVHQNRANAVRSNYPFGEVVSDTLTVNGEGVLGKNDLGQIVYEPHDQQKGDIARALFYMSLRYTESGTLWALPMFISESVGYGQDQNILKSWNKLDPPDGFEMARNDYLDSLQENRNPFIDNPDYACYINFHTMKKIPEGCDELGVSQENINAGFTIYPNPAKSHLILQSNDVPFSSYRITNVQGQALQHREVFHSFLNKIDLQFFDKGVYFIQITTEKGIVSKRFIIN